MTPTPPPPPVRPAASGHRTASYRRGCRLLADPSLGFKGAAVHRCAFLDHSSELEKNGFLQSSVPSRPLESFHKKRGSEFSGSAGAHSDHSAPTRPWATLIKRGDAFQATHGPRAFYLGVGGVTRPGLLGTIPVLALRVQSREKPSTPDKLGWPVTF